MDNIKNITISIDSRENELNEYFKQYDFITKTTLDLGDIIFFRDDKPFLIIERKTINDLYASIIDGRYREQKERLFKSNCNFLYLVEGNLYLHKFKSTLIGSVCNLMFRDDIKVIRTINTKETIKYIEKMCIKYEKGDFEVKRNENISNYRIKKKDCYGVKDCFKLQLNVIPRVSLNMAKMLSDKFENMNNLITYLKENGERSLKDLEYNTGNKMRKIGNKMSEKIYYNLYN